MIILRIFKCHTKLKNVTNKFNQVLKSKIQIQSNSFSCFQNKNVCVRHDVKNGYDCSRLCTQNM